MERGLRRQKIAPQASACCAKSPKFSDFPGVDPAQQQVRLNVTGVLVLLGVICKIRDSHTMPNGLAESVNLVIFAYLCTV